MSVAVVADAHLGGPGGSAVPLIRQLEALPGEGCSHLLLLGDLFHIWVGDARYDTPDIVAVAECLRGLRQQGLEISYVEGNRDFFLQHSHHVDAFDRIGLEAVVTVEGTRFLAVHGDGLNDRDWRYRFWRRLSKSLPSRLLFHNLPGPVARRVVHGTEKGLTRTNFKHKVEIPRAVITEYGRRRLSEGFDVLLLGHFHDPLSISVPEGEIRLIEAWFQNREIPWLAPSSPGPVLSLRPPPAAASRASAGRGGQSAGAES